MHKMSLIFLGLTSRVIRFSERIHDARSRGAADDVYVAALPLRSFPTCRAERRSSESLWPWKGSEGDIYTL